MKKYDGPDVFEDITAVEQAEMKNECPKTENPAGSSDDSPFSSFFQESKLGKWLLIGRILAALCTVVWATASTINTVRSWMPRHQQYNYNTEPITSGGHSPVGEQPAANPDNKMAVYQSLIDLNTWSEKTVAVPAREDIALAEAIINSENPEKKYKDSEINSLFKP